MFVNGGSIFSFYCLTNNRAVISLVMSIIICVVKISFVNAICTSFIGLAYGPVFPTVMSLASELLVPEARLVSMALM